MATNNLKCKNNGRSLKQILFCSFCVSLYANIVHLPSNVKAGRENWGRGRIGKLEQQNFQFGPWKPVDNSIENHIQQQQQQTSSTTTSKPLTPLRNNFPVDSKFRIQNLDMLHKYARHLYNGKIPRRQFPLRHQQPAAQNRVAIYIKPLGELGDLPKSARLKQSSAVQNGHQFDPESLYTEPYDNVGTQGPWIPTIQKNNSSYTNIKRNDAESTKNTMKTSLERMPKNEDLDAKPFGDTVIQASLSVSGNKAAKIPEHHKKNEKETATESVTELSTSSNRKYYYYPTSFPSNQNPFPSSIHSHLPPPPPPPPPKQSYIPLPPKLFHKKRPRAENNRVKPQTHKRYIPASVVSERKDFVPSVPKNEVKTNYYHTPQAPETLTRPERDSQYQTYEDDHYVHHQHHPQQHNPPPSLPSPHSPPQPAHLPHGHVQHHPHGKSSGLPDECFIETPCTRSCGSGFKLLLPNPSSLHSCYGATLQVHPCELKPCAVHCHWGRWSEWSACTVTGRRRKRSAVSEPEPDKHSSRSVPHNVYHHGQPTILPPASVRTLNGHPSGSICSQSRQRAVEVPPKHYGKECKGEHSENRFCQSYECRGPHGHPGPKGPPGHPGQDGSPGLPGYPGNDGPQGKPGEQGPSGPSGLTGQRGQKGSPGIQGVSGPQGPVGAAGPRGRHGEKGVVGPPGTLGEAGPPGKDGEVGSAGPRGPPGRNGIPGSLGPMGKLGVQGLQGLPGKSGPRGLTGPKGETGHPGELVYAPPSYEHPPVEYPVYNNAHQTHLDHVYPEYRDGSGRFYPKTNKLKRESVTSNYQTPWDSGKTKPASKINVNIKRMDNNVTVLSGRDSISKKAEFFSDLFQSTNSAKSLLELDPEMTLADNNNINLLRDVDVQKLKFTKSQKKRKNVGVSSGKKTYGNPGPVKIKTRYSKKPPSRLATSILYPTSTKVINIRRNFETDSLVDVLQKDKNTFAGFQRQSFGNSPKPTVQVSYTRGDYSDFANDNMVSEDRHKDGNTIITYDTNNKKIPIKPNSNENDNGQETSEQNEMENKELMKNKMSGGVNYTNYGNELNIEYKEKNLTVEEVKKPKSTKLWSDRPIPKKLWPPNNMEKVIIVPTPNLVNRKKYRKPPKRKLIRKTIRQRAASKGVNQWPTTTTTTERYNNKKYTTSDSLKKVAESFAPFKIKKYKNIRNEDLYSSPTTESSIEFKSKQDETTFNTPTTITDNSFESKKKPPAHYVATTYHPENKYNERRETENVQQNQWPLQDYPQPTTYVPPHYPPIPPQFYRKI